MDPIQISLPRTTGQASLFDTLSPGQSARGIVESAGGASTIRVGANTIPLPDGSQLGAGTRVQVSVTIRDGSPLVEVRPLATQNPASAPGTTRAGFEALLNAAIRARGLTATAADIAPLIPNALPPNPQYLQQIAELLTLRTPMGDQLGKLVAHIQSAVQNGWAAPPAVLQLLDQYLRWQSSEGFERLRVAARWARSSNEAALTQGDRPPTVPGDLLGQLRALVSDREFLTALGSRQAASDAGTLAGELVTRLESQQLQNLHALEQFYAFFEIPIADDEFPIQLHWRREPDADTGESIERIHIDVILSAIGNVWIDLHAGSYCTCSVKFGDEATVSLAERSRTSLADGLKAIGFEPVNVIVGMWDGDSNAALRSDVFVPTSMDVQA